MMLYCYVQVIRMAGRKWELQKLFRGRCYILPCFHSPYGTHKPIVEASVRMGNKTSFKTETCRAAQAPQQTDS